MVGGGGAFCQTLPRVESVDPSQPYLMGCPNFPGAFTVDNLYAGSWRRSSPCSCLPRRGICDRYHAREAPNYRRSRDASNTKVSSKIGTLAMRSTCLPPWEGLYCYKGARGLMSPPRIAAYRRGSCYSDASPREGDTGNNITTGTPEGKDSSFMPVSAWRGL